MEDRRAIFLMQQTFTSFFSLTNKLQLKGDQYLSSLTSRQLMLMMAIIHLQQEETSLNNIARKMGTTKQSVKQLVDLVEKKGFVKTIPSPKDKRAVNVVITPTGSKVFYDDALRGMNFFYALFHEFSTDDLETLWGLLKKLYRFDGEEQDGFEEEVIYKPNTN